MGGIILKDFPEFFWADSLRLIVVHADTIPMMRPIRLLHLVLLGLSLLPDADFSGRVVAIADGDTISALHDGKAEKIRLYGIDCPESRQAFGTRAKQFTSYRRSILFAYSDDADHRSEICRKVIGFPSVWSSPSSECAPVQLSTDTRFKVECRPNNDIWFELQ